MSSLAKFKHRSFGSIVSGVLNRVFKTRIDTFHYLTIDLDVYPSDNLDMDEIAKELTFDDFKIGDKSNFSDSKLKLIKSRLDSPNYRAFGIVENHALLYSTWISFGRLTMPNGMQFPLNDDEGLLEDSYCSPKARGRGFHSRMNMFRLKKIKELGKKRVIAVVLDGNIPAMRVQMKSGFKESFSFKSGYILGIPFTTKLKK